MMFFRVTSFLVAFTVLAALPARAETAGDIVAKNLAARGGAAPLAAIGTIEFEGKVVYPGDFELSYKELRARSAGKALVQSSIEGLTLVQGYDGSVGWRINPFEGRRDAERMSDDDARALADDATIDGPLLTARTKGSTIAYLGREDYEGTSTFKLRVSEPSGVVYTYFLDPDTYLEIKVIETRKLRGAPQTTLTEYGDYEQVSGVYFPFEITSGPLGSPPDGLQKLTIATAKANVAVTDAMFAMPAAPGAK